MTDPYEVLAPYYDSLGMSDFAFNTTPGIINHAHGLDWVGRKVVDLGCGTGGSIRWFATHGYNITGIEPSAAMLHAAKRSVDGAGVGLQWIQGDATEVEPLHDVDLVLAVDVMNEMNNVRDLEALFNSVARGLAAGKLFVFDLHTLEGLAGDHGLTHVLRNDERLTAITTSEYDHERQTRTDSYTLFRVATGGWARGRAVRGRRGFPLHVVTALLGRAGFNLLSLVDPAFHTVQATAPHVPRVICFAQRLG